MLSKLRKCQNLYFPDNDFVNVYVVKVSTLFARVYLRQRRRVENYFFYFLLPPWFIVVEIMVVGGATRGQLTGLQTTQHLSKWQRTAVIS